MIYCVVPQALEDELYDKLVDYYKDDPNVKVIIDRRAGADRRASDPPEAEQRTLRDKRQLPARSGAAAAPGQVDKVVVHVDGGSRGNPGPAAAAAVATDAGRHELGERNAYIGEATNNVAEYRAILLGWSSRASSGRRGGARERLGARRAPDRWRVQGEEQGLKPLFRETMRRSAGSTAGASARCGASRTSARTSSSTRRWTPRVPRA